jgi:hypothetical protein
MEAVMIEILSTEASLDKNLEALLRQKCGRPTGSFHTTVHVIDSDCVTETIVWPSRLGTTINEDQVAVAIGLCRCAVINENFVDVTYLQEMAHPASGIALPLTAALSKALLAAGYGYIDRTKRRKIRGKMRTIVMKPCVGITEVLGSLKNFDY